MGNPAKRYSPAVSVRALRFNPVPWLAIVTLTPGTTASLGSVIVPETVASWVCDQALTEKSAANATDGMQGRYDARFAPGGAPIQLFVTWARLKINSVSFFCMAPSISDTRSTPNALRKPPSFSTSFVLDEPSNLADPEFATDLLIQQPAHH